MRNLVIFHSKLHFIQYYTYISFRSENATIMLVSFNYCFLTGIVILVSLLFLKRLQPNFFANRHIWHFLLTQIFWKNYVNKKRFNNSSKLAIFLRYLSLFTCQNLQRRTLICFSSAPLAFSEKTQFAFCFATHDMTSRAREEHASMWGNLLDFTTPFVVQTFWKNIE